MPRQSRTPNESRHRKEDTPHGGSHFIITPVAMCLYVFFKLQNSTLVARTSGCNLSADNLKDGTQ